MKKVAIGCAVVIVLCMIGFGAVAFYVYYKANQYMASLKQFAAVAEMDKNVTNQRSFSEPAGGELTDDQVRRFVSVQESMHSKLGARIEELNAKMKQFEQLQHAEHRDANVSEVFTAISDLMGLIMQAKTAQVDALNASHFSLGEYKWVRGQVYSAAGMSVAQVNFAALQEQIKSNGGTVSPDLEQMSRDVPERNKTLVKPYVEKMKDWIPFAFFGL
jgi:vacuolar-type H+-ATPase subunit I/STV1